MSISGRRALRFTSIVLLLGAGAPSLGQAPPAGKARALVGAESVLRYRVNREPRGIGPSWVREDFDDRDWKKGGFPVGLETGTPVGARGLIRTPVAAPASSIYVRCRFRIDDPERIDSLYVGADYDDGFVAWINGVEVARSDTMPDGSPKWDARPSNHESSNGSLPRFHPRLDISEAGIPALHPGENLLALGVWNAKPDSSDLVLAAELLADQPLETFITRGPYLQLATETAVTVSWRTDRPTDSRVSHGAKPGALRDSVSDPRRTTDHRLRITGLKPDSTVYYAVGTSTTILAGDDDEHVFRTAPPRGSRRPLRLWIVGDSGTAGAIPGWVRDGYERYAAGRPPDLWILLGDGAYDYGTDDRYQVALFETYPRMLRRSVLWPTPGNHDLEGTLGSLRGAYYEVFELPAGGEAGGVASGTERYYSFDFGNVHFVALNSEHASLEPEAPMLRWLERDLRAVDAAATDWIVAFWHHAPYATGYHDSDTDARAAAMRRHAVPILDAHGVDLVLVGHTHTCQRSSLIRGHYGPKATFDSQMQVDGSTGRPDLTGPYRKTMERRGGDGIVYAVVGCSGENTEKSPPIR